MSRQSLAAGVIVFRPGERGITLTLAPPKKNRRPSTIGAFSPASAEEQLRRAASAVRWEDFSGGLGYSRRLVPNTYAWAEGVYTRSPRLAMPAGEVVPIPLPSPAPGDPPLGPITASAEFNGDLYLSAGPYVLKLAGGSGAPTISNRMSADPNARVDSLAVFKDALYAGGQVPPDIMPLWRYRPGDGWASKTEVPRRFLATVYWINSQGVGAHVLVGTDGDSSFRYVANDPFTPEDWTPDPSTPSIRVGNPAYAINSLAASPQHVYAVKSNGVHDIDGRGYNPNLTPYWEQAWDPSNGDVSLVRSGEVFASHFQGLDRVNVASQIQLNVPAWVHPGSVVPNETPIFGPVTALCQDAGWLVASFYNGSSSYLCWGRPRDELPIAVQGPSFIWHGAEAVIRGERVTHLRVSALDGTPRLYIASLRNTTPKLYAMSLPKASSPLQDFRNGGPWRPTEEAMLYLPAEDWDAPLASKTLLRYTLRADQLGPSFIELFARADEGLFFREGLASRSPAAIFDSGAVATGFDLQLGLRLVTRAGRPPLLRGVEALASIHHQPVQVRVYTVQLGEAMDLYSGAAFRADQLETWHELQRLQRAGPVEFIDELGERWLAEVQEGIESAYEEDDTGRGWLIVAVLRVTLLNRIWQWGSGETYDRRAVWGRAARPVTIETERGPGGLLVRWRLRDAPLLPRRPIIIEIRPPGGDFGEMDRIPDIEGEIEIPWTDLEDCGNYTIRLTDGETVLGELTVPGLCVGGPPPASFSLVIIQEKVLQGGSYVDLFTVCAKNTTPGTWTSYSWTAAGPGVTNPSGDQPEFVTGFTSLSGASISLTVRNADGQEQTYTNSNLAGSATVQTLELYTAEGTAAGAFDGATWRTAASPGGDVLVVGRGPAWSTTTGLALASGDNLATPPVVTNPFGGTPITADWMETDASLLDRAVGAADGRIAISHDAGATWTVKPGPTTNPVLRVILSRFTAGEVWVLDATSIWISHDWGDTWELLRLAGSGQTFTDLVLAHSRNVVVGYDERGATMERAEDGAPFQLPPLDPPLERLNAVAAHITQDRFFAYDNSVPPRTLVTQDNGGWVMVEGTRMPADVTAAPERGMVTVGAEALPTEVAGGGGAVVWKWLNFGGDLGGFRLLRQANTAGAGPGPFVMVGHGRRSGPTPPSGSGDAVVAATTEGFYVWNGSGWDVIPLSAAGLSSSVCLLGRSWTANDRTVYMADGALFGTPTVLARSNDGGRTWSQHPLPQNPEHTFYYVGSSMVGVDPVDPNHIFLYDHWTVGSTSYNQVWESHDGGASWSHTTTSGSVALLMFGQIGHSGRILVRRSQHPGGTFLGLDIASLDLSSSQALPEAASGGAISVHDVVGATDGKFTVVLASQAYLHSSVGSYTTINIPRGRFDLEFTVVDLILRADGVGVAVLVSYNEANTVSDTRVLRTTNNGVSWTTVYQDVVFSDASITIGHGGSQMWVIAGRYLGTGKAMLVSLDDGLTWQLTSAGTEGYEGTHGMAVW